MPTARLAGPPGDMALSDLPQWKRALLDQIDLLIADKSRCTIVIEKDGPAILVKPAKLAWQTVVRE